MARLALNSMIVPASQHTLFMRGFYGNMNKEDVREFFTKEGGKCSFDFVKLSEDRRLLFVALRFESKDVAKDIMARYHDTDVLGSRISISWYKDLRKARQKAFDAMRDRRLNDGRHYNNRRSDNFFPDKRAHNRRSFSSNRVKRSFSYDEGSEEGEIRNKDSVSRSRSPHDASSISRSTSSARAKSSDREGSILNNGEDANRNRGNSLSSRSLSSARHSLASHPANSPGKEKSLSPPEDGERRRKSGKRKKRMPRGYLDNPLVNEDESKIDASANHNDQPKVVEIDNTPIFNEKSPALAAYEEEEEDIINSNSNLNMNLNTGSRIEENTEEKEEGALTNDNIVTNEKDSSGQDNIEATEKYKEIIEKEKEYRERKERRERKPFKGIGRNYFKSSPPHGSRRRRESPSRNSNDYKFSKYEDEEQMSYRGGGGGKFYSNHHPRSRYRGGGDGYRGQIDHRRNVNYRGQRDYHGQHYNNNGSSWYQGRGNRGGRDTRRHRGGDDSRSSAERENEINEEREQGDHDETTVDLESTKLGSLVRKRKTIRELSKNTQPSTPDPATLFKNTMIETNTSTTSLTSFDNRASTTDLRETPNSLNSMDINEIKSAGVNIAGNIPASEADKFLASVLNNPSGNQSGTVAAAFQHHLQMIGGYPGSNLYTINNTNTNATATTTKIAINLKMFASNSNAMNTINTQTVDSSRSSLWNQDIGTNNVPGGGGVTYPFPGVERNEALAGGINGLDKNTAILRDAYAKFMDDVINNQSQNPYNFNQQNRNANTDNQSTQNNTNNIGSLKQSEENDELRTLQEKRQKRKNKKLGEVENTEVNGISDDNFEEDDDWRNMAGTETALHKSKKGGSKKKSYIDTQRTTADTQHKSADKLNEELRARLQEVYHHEKETSTNKRKQRISYDKEGATNNYISDGEDLTSEESIPEYKKSKRRHINPEEKEEKSKASSGFKFKTLDILESFKNKIEIAYKEDCSVLYGVSKLLANSPDDALRVSIRKSADENVKNLANSCLSQMKEIFQRIKSSALDA
ncbi:probable cyclin-dependent serine/threonine-protein kinase DDB_G0292550 isoform X2 [Gordionus sp. m RMFG-2023]|uniref:probable cyclin-dependent serine/threonine-protein kinase DDB_G0292550 isoform X2 n=1 Tax=Gordionus sp. m RMFG-2023 TaxID=3053472 RepID=UPI0031FD5CEF